MLDSLNIKNVIKIEGGKTRAQSTFLALKRIKKLKCLKVLIHDAARPNVSNQLIKNVIGRVSVIHSQEALYLAGPNEILDQLSKIHNNHNTVMIIGHNPGLDILAQSLVAKGSNSAAVKSLQKGFPTAAMAIFQLKGNNWQNLASDGAELLTFMSPYE